jgi:putative ABC transport system substrate-binding protein
VGRLVSVNQGGTAGIFSPVLVFTRAGFLFARKPTDNKSIFSEEKKMKKIVSLLLSVVLVLGLFTACGNNAESDTSLDTPRDTDEVYKVAIVQLVDNSAFTEMREAFINRMRALGYDEAKMTFDIKNAQGDQSALNTICEGLKTADYDLVVPIVTPATIAVVNQELSCPTVFISVTDPVSSGILTTMEAPDKNATGTSNIVPVDQIFTLAKTLTPSVKNIGILYCSGEQNAVQTAEKAKTYLSANGFTYKEVTVASSAEVQQAAQSLAADVDAIYIPIDSTVQAAMSQVVEAANAKKIPVYGSDPVMVKFGALACVSVSNTQLGEKSAEMADEILRGKKVSEVPAVAMEEFQYVIGKAAADTLGVTLPSGDNYTVIG